MELRSCLERAFLTLKEIIPLTTFGLFSKLWVLNTTFNQALYLLVDQHILHHFQLQTWDRMPGDKPVLSAFSRASGQEWFYADISKETIRNIITVGKTEQLMINKSMWTQQNVNRCCYLQVLNPSAEKTSLLWAAIENLQKGTSWNYRRPFLIFEARYFQATTLGFPVEISKYYNTLSAVTVNCEESKLKRFVLKVVGLLT